MDPKPIPALYCCYLLRSIKYPRRLYVGSTPDVFRRRAQHNGQSKGGAVRTSRDKFRPSEMTVIVTGFPSKIAALQFEWAWNNPHITRKIPSDQRITHPIKPKKPDGKRKRKGPIKPCISLDNMLKNLHLLTRVPSFSRWPLRTRFFYDDVYQIWFKMNEKVDQSKVTLDLEPPHEASEVDKVLVKAGKKAKRRPRRIGQGGVEGLDVTYNGMTSYLEKSEFLLAEDDAVQCKVCHATIDLAPKTALVCPEEGCRTAFHLGCLAAKFLQSGNEEKALLPISGHCPCCKAQLQWIDLIKELSLRTKGRAIVDRLMRKSRKAKLGSSKTTRLPASQLNTQMLANDNGIEEDSDEDVDGEDVDDSLSDDWQYQEDDDDMMSVTSAESGCSESIAALLPKASKAPKSKPRLRAVIEDSEGDEAEALD